MSACAYGYISRIVLIVFHVDGLLSVNEVR